MRTSNVVLLLALAAGTSTLSPSAIAAESREESPKSLGKITVSAEDEGDSMPATTTVVGARQFEEEQAQNFEDAIRYIPGVSFVDMGRFGDNGFNIRGLEGDRVAMSVDGLPFAESLETTPAYEFFRRRPRQRRHRLAEAPRSNQGCGLDHRGQRCARRRRHLHDEGSVRLPDRRWQ